MTVEDLLVTRMQVVGAGGYARDIYMGARALGVLKTDLDEAQRAQLAMSVVSAAASATIIAGFAKATLAAGQHEAILVRASASFTQFGHNIPQAEIEAWSNSVQDATGIARDQVASIEGLYAEYGLGAQQAQRFTKATLEASVALKAQGTSAEQITRFVGTAIQMVQQGDTKGLSLLGRRIGIVVNEAKAATDPMGALLDALNRKGGDQAELYKNTLPGAINAFRSSVVRLGQDVGTYFVGPLTEALKLATRLVDFLDQHPALAAGAGVAVAGGLGIRAIGGAASLISGLGLARAGIGGLLARGAAAGGIAAGGGAVASTAALLIKQYPGLTEKQAAVMAAQINGSSAAAVGFGARAAGFLRSPLFLGTAIGTAALAGHEALRGNESGMGILGRILTGTAAGAGFGAAGGSLFGPGGTVLGGLAGAATGAITSGLEIQSERESKRSNQEAMEELTKSNQDLRGEINALNKNLGNLVGDRDLRATIGDARIVASFARDIA